MPSTLPRRAGLPVGFSSLCFPTLDSVHHFSVSNLSILTLNTVFLLFPFNSFFLFFFFFLQIEFPQVLKLMHGFKK